MHIHLQKQKRKHHERGFTLVEMMVSLMVFSIVMTISVGTLLIMIDVNAKAQALYSSMTNVSFALDSMTREIRMGYGYYCDVSEEVDFLPDQSLVNDCDDADEPRNFISFTRGRDGAQFAYRLQEDEEGVGYIEQNENDTWIAITSTKDIDIDTFELIVGGTETFVDGGNTEQPYVDVFIKGTLSNGLDVDTDFSVQTRIVQRRLDII